MYGKSLVSIGLLALLALQGMEASRPPVPGVREEVFETEFDILMKHLNIIQAGILADALKTHRPHVDTAAAQKQKFLDAGLVPIKRIVNYAQYFIKLKTQEAAQAGVDISACTAGKPEQIESLSTKVSGQVISCISGPADVAINTIKKDHKYLTDASKTITTLPRDYFLCFAPGGGSKCLDKVMDKATDLSDNLPGRIPQILATALNLLDTLDAKVQPCIDEGINMINGPVGNIIVTVAQCVKDVTPRVRS